jgi:peroxiredoxin
VRTDIQVGAMFPDYELMDQAGKHRKLSELQGRNAMVLHLSRGGTNSPRGCGVGEFAKTMRAHRFSRHDQRHP